MRHADVFRLTWAPTEECPGEYRNQPYANFRTREEAFKWGSVLIRVGAKNVRVAPAKGNARPQELFAFLAGIFGKRHPKIKPSDPTNESRAEWLAAEVGVRVYDESA